jgi:hypothetical protein
VSIKSSIACRVNGRKERVGKAVLDASRFTIFQIGLRLSLCNLIDQVPQTLHSLFPLSECCNAEQLEVDPWLTVCGLSEPRPPPAPPAFVNLPLPAISASKSLDHVALFSVFSFACSLPATQCWLIVSRDVSHCTRGDRCLLRRNANGTSGGACGQQLLRVYQDSHFLWSIPHVGVDRSGPMVPVLIPAWSRAGASRSVSRMEASRMSICHWAWLILTLFPSDS